MALIPSSSSLLLPNFSNFNTVKLDINNLPTWKKIVGSYLRANGLYGHVDGSKPQPSETDPSFPDWYAKDNMVITILTSSLTETVLAQVLDCSTALSIWTTAHNIYASNSSSQMVQTRLQLTSLKKGSEPVSEYVAKAKALVSAINAAGQTVSDAELVVYILAGLGSDYDSVVTSVSTQVELPSSTQVLTYLINHEVRLNSKTKSLLGPPPLSVNNTHTSYQAHTPEANHSASQGRGNRGGYRGGRSGSNSGGRGGGDSGRGRGGRTFSGAPDTRSICQLCDKRGHTAPQCWFRFDHAFQPPAPRSFQAHNTMSNWYPDTAATHHFTPDISNLNIGNLPYPGTDTVTLGDGSSIPIQNHGSTTLLSSNKSFILSKLLHAPALTKNLLYNPCLSKELLAEAERLERRVLIFDPYAEERLLLLLPGHQVPMKFGAPETLDTKLIRKQRGGRRIFRIGDIWGCTW